MYMATLGGQGLRDLARLNYDHAEYLKGALRSAGVEIPFSPPTFNEFVAKFPEGFEKKHAALLEKRIVAGLHLKPYYPDLENHYLLCATETLSKGDMDALVKEATS
jgi:glycine dehydrogenase subunit 1